MDITATIGLKVTQGVQFNEAGKRLPVTYIKTGPLFVVGVKSKEKDGYNAIQFGLDKRRITGLTNGEKGFFKKIGMEQNPSRYLREVRLDGATDEELKTIAVGQEMKVSTILKVGDTVAVTGISKGKGFQGGVRRHGFKGGPRTHGQSDRERAPGAIGQTTTPGRVYKGKRMAGRMGNTQTTVKNLKVFAVDDQNNQIAVTGLIPGGRNSVVIIRKSNKK